MRRRKGEQRVDDTEEEQEGQVLVPASKQEGAVSQPPRVVTGRIAIFRRADLPIRLFLLRVNCDLACDGLARLLVLLACRQVGSLALHTRYP